MTFRTGPAFVLLAALLAGAPTLAAAECGSAIRGGITVASVKGAEFTAQQRAKKAGKTQNATEKSGPKACPPEHEAQGRC